MKGEGPWDQGIMRQWNIKEHVQVHVHEYHHLLWEVSNSKNIQKWEVSNLPFPAVTRGKQKLMTGTKQAPSELAHDAKWWGRMACHARKGHLETPHFQREEPWFPVRSHERNSSVCRCFPYPCLAVTL